MIKQVDSPGKTCDVTALYTVSNVDYSAKRQEFPIERLDLS